MSDPIYGDMPDETVAKALIDRISSSIGLGAIYHSITNTCHGINHRGMGNGVPMNQDQHGLTFFTRPCMNMSYDNLSSDRTTTPLITKAELSYQRYIRCLLDPRAGLGGSKTLALSHQDNSLFAALSGLFNSNAKPNQNGIQTDTFNTPLLDPHCAFIPLLTNNLISISGWPDQQVATYTSKPGVMGESWSMYDGTIKIYGTQDLTVNLRNMLGDPLSLLFGTWLTYGANVYSGQFNPYADLILGNIIDYQTRIYRLVLDPTRRFVQKIAATGAAFPIANPIGGVFDYNEEHVFNLNIKEMSVPFRCMGIIYNDPLLFTTFNMTVAAFNPNMADPPKAYVDPHVDPDAIRNQNMRKLTMAERMVFNYHGYPRIDPITQELEIWVDNAVYQYIMNPKPYHANDLAPSIVNALGNAMDSKTGSSIGSTIGNIASSLSASGGIPHNVADLEKAGQNLLTQNPKMLSQLVADNFSSNFKNFIRNS